MSFLFGLLFTLLGLYVGLVFAAAHFAVHPRRIPIPLNPLTLNLPSETVRIDGQEGVLVAWAIPCASEIRPRGTLIFLHGYYLNRCEWLLEAWRAHHDGWNVVMPDFRAFGNSQGRTTTIGSEERWDVLAVAAWARARFGGPVVAWGSSMGAAAAAFAAGEDPEALDGVILDSVYGRLDRAVAGWWRFVGGPPLAAILSPVWMVAAGMVRFDPRKADVAEALPKFPKPILMLHGAQDDLARPDEARRIAARNPHVELVWFENSQHSSARWDEPVRYSAEADRWLDHHFPRS